MQAACRRRAEEKRLVYATTHGNQYVYKTGEFFLRQHTRFYTLTDMKHGGKWWGIELVLEFSLLMSIVGQERLPEGGGYKSSAGL